MSVWLVTGGAGFLGRHVLAALCRQNSPASRVVTIGRRAPQEDVLGDFLPCDLADAAELETTLDTIRPDYVIHAAGRTPPADPASFYRENTRVTITLLAALAARLQPTRVVLVGSAAELGSVPVADLPVAEPYPCRPSGAYALSKWFAMKAGLQAGPPLEVMAARVFNPIGPGMAGNQAFGRFAALLGAPGRGSIALRVGDLETRRDFIDARDVAEALIALGLRGRGQTLYHVGTGRSHSVGDGLTRLIALCRRPVEIDQAPGGAAPLGPSDSRADIARIQEHVGWAPRIPFSQSLTDLWAETSGRSRSSDSSRHVA